MPKKFYDGEGEKYNKGFANMPEEKVMKPYPKSKFGAAEQVRDGIEGIDMLADDANRQIMKKPGGRY